MTIITKIQIKRITESNEAFCLIDIFSDNQEEKSIPSYFYPWDLDEFKKDLVDYASSYEKEFDIIETPLLSFYSDTVSLQRDINFKYTLRIQKVNEHYFLIETDEFYYNQNEINQLIPLRKYHELYQKNSSERNYYNKDISIVQTDLSNENYLKFDINKKIKDFTSKRVFEGSLRFFEPSIEDAYYPLREQIEVAVENRDFKKAKNIYDTLFNDFAICSDDIGPYLRIMYQAEKGYTNFEDFEKFRKYTNAFVWVKNVGFNILSRSCQFTFGKYEGEFIGVVMLKDPSYVFWCVKEIPSFLIEENLFYPFTISDNIGFYSALECILYKNSAMQYILEERSHEREREEQFCRENPYWDY